MNKIAVCGKGGSGKSVVARLLADGLRERGRRVLVVDADESNTGLHRMLGFENPPSPIIGLLGGKQKLEEEIEGKFKDIADGLESGEKDLVEVFGKTRSDVTVWQAEPTRENVSKK